MAGIAEVGAKDGKKPEKEHSKVTIYFGVFFDGTNNHRLQVMIGKMYRKKEKVNKENSELTEDEKSIAEKFTLDYQLEAQISKSLEFDEDRLKRLEAFRKDNRSLTVYDQRYIDYEMNEVNKNKENIASYNSLLSGEIDDLKDSLHKKGSAIQNNDFTNIALLEPFYRAKEEKDISDDEFVYRIYVSGSGTDRVLENVGDNIGAGFGQGSTGVIQKVEDALTCINSKLTLFTNVLGDNITLIFHLFGFSRGATEARIFAHVVNKQKKEQDFGKSLWKHVFEGKDRIKGIVKKGNISIPAMGIYDTVASVGVLFKNTIGNKALIDYENIIDTWSKLHHKNVNDLGLNDLGMVDDVYHICALDEYRENFALVPIYESDARKKTEIYIPGCHADVGGGYSEGKDKKVTLYAGDNTYYPIIPKPYHLILDSAKGEPVFKKENYVKLNNEQWPDQNMRLKLSEIGWVNSTEKGEYNYIPPISFSFDKSTKKGYSYIGLHLMRDYFDYLGLFNIIEKFSVPPDLNTLKGEIKTFQGKGGVDKCFELNPARYAWLRNQYLHFSAEEYWNINQVKVNSPHFFHKDNSKYYCRIEYTNEYCKKVDKEYVEYQIKRLETIDNHLNQML